MVRKAAFLSLSLLCSVNLYGVHAHAIRSNNACSINEQRGNPDVIDQHIFLRRPILNFAHITATPGQLVAVRKETFETWHAWVLDAMSKRSEALVAENAAHNANDEGMNLAIAAYDRITMLYERLKNGVYAEIDTDLIAVPETDVVILMQWAERIVVTGDDVVPVVTIILDDMHALTASSCCGDLPQVISDHMYWQKVIEAGWVAVDPDALGRVQPILHTNVIGEKFHFYKTRFGVYFRETLSGEEKAPGDLVRIIKYLPHDPRHNQTIHGSAPIVWLKFPSDPQFNPSLDGQYIPGSNRSLTASWVYVHDFQNLLAELNK